MHMVNRQALISPQPDLFQVMILKGICTPNQNWACFVCYLKTNTMIILMQIF